MIEISKLNPADFANKTVEEKVEFLNGMQSGFCNISFARGGKKAIYFNLEKSVEFSKFAFVKNVCFFIILEGPDCAFLDYDWKSWYKNQHQSYANIDILSNMLGENKSPNSDILLDYVLESFNQTFWGDKKWEDVREEIQAQERLEEETKKRKEAQNLLEITNSQIGLIKSFWFANPELLEKAKQINNGRSVIGNLNSKIATQIRAFLKKKLKDHSKEQIENLIVALGLFLEKEQQEEEKAKKAAKAARAAMYATK